MERGAGFFAIKFLPLAQIRRGLGRAVGLASALALAGVLAFAAGVAGLASAQAFTGVLAFAVVLSRARVIGQLAFADRGALIRIARIGRLQARRRTGHQPGQGDGCKHGFGGLKETWIFHVNTSLSYFPACYLLTYFRPAPSQAKSAITLLDEEIRVLFPGCAVFQEKLLGRVLIRNRLLARVVGPNGSLNAAAALAAI